MASATLKPTVFPVGTSVSLYLANQLPLAKTDNIPTGAAITTATVAADGTLTFVGIADGVNYLAYAATFGIERFRTDDPRVPGEHGTLEPFSDVRRRAWLNGAAVDENMQRADCVADLSALTTQIMFLAGGVVIPAGKTVTRVKFIAGATPAGTPTNQWFGIVRASDLVLLAVTADDLTTAWAANTAKELLLSSPLTVADDTPVYLACVVKATTVPTLRGSNLGNAIVSSAGTSPILCGTSSTGLTVPTATGAAQTAITATANLPFCSVR